MLSIIFIVVIFMLAYRVESVLNPYIQTAIIIGIMTIEFFTLVFLEIQPSLVAKIFSVSVMIFTIYVGVSFIKYYKRLSKMQDDKINGGKK